MEVLPLLSILCNIIMFVFMMGVWEELKKIRKQQAKLKDELQKSIDIQVKEHSRKVNESVGKLLDQLEKEFKSK